MSALSYEMSFQSYADKMKTIIRRTMSRFREQTKVNWEMAYLHNIPFLLT